MSMTAACRICEDREWRNRMGRKSASEAAERRAKGREAQRLFGTGKIEPIMAGPGRARPDGPRCYAPHQDQGSWHKLPAQCVEPTVQAC